MPRAGRRGATWCRLGWEFDSSGHYSAHKWHYERISRRLLVESERHRSPSGGTPRSGGNDPSQSTTSAVNNDVYSPRKRG